MNDSKHTHEAIRERVQDMVSRNFSITKCPEKVYEKFVTFCKEETNNNYSMGLKVLLDAKEANIKEVVLFEQYIELKKRVESLESGEEPDKPKTFGKG